MADEDEVDILGEYEITSASVLTASELSLDSSELSSQSSDFLSEFHHHPWLLEQPQNWYLDQNIDEKSKLAIEKMLQEEREHYVGGFIRKDAKNKDGIVKKELISISSTHKKPWSESEKELFIKGLEIFGRKWTKISQYIGSRSTLQVKNFARQYLKTHLQTVLEDKIQENKRIKMDTQNSDSSALEEKSRISNPPLATTESIASPESNLSNQENDNSSILNNNSSEQDQKVFQNKVALSNVREGEIIHLRKPCSSDSSEDEVDIEDECAVETNNFKAMTNDSDSNYQENNDRFQNGDEKVAEKEDYVNIDVKNKFSVKPNNSDDKIEETNSVLSTETKTFSLLTNSEVIEDNYSVCNSELTNLYDLIDDNYNVNLLCPSESEAEFVVCNDTRTKNKLSSDSDAVLNLGFESEGNDSGTTSMTIECNHNPEDNRICLENFDLPVPVEEIKLNKQIITEDEKLIHHDFFESKPPKTPERYLKIRNYILDSWEKSKPHYLNKTSVRPGLKNCGDVNCIGRIHSYLELIGAINFGCEQAQYNRQLPFTSTKINREKNSNEITVRNWEKKESMRPRKPKSLKFGSDSEGYTIEHKDDGQEIISTNENVKTYGQSKVKNRISKDPFTLIPCSEFSEDFKEPFHVEIETDAMVIMDLHAHISYTEVIGLVGGHYNLELKQMKIMAAEPCESLSTGLQCEMDPVSQTLASESLQQQGFDVVGWYHSHPTFPPNPSLRDLETQSKYQEWLGKGNMPFVALIISPYHNNNQNSPLISKMCCMIVGNKSASNNYSVPYKFKTEFSNLVFNPQHCLKQIEAILKRFGNKPTLPPLFDVYAPQPTVTYLEKMLMSIEHHFGKDQDELPANVAEFLLQLKELFLKILNVPALKND